MSEVFLYKCAPPLGGARAVWSMCESESSVKKGLNFRV